MKFSHIYNKVRPLIKSNFFIGDLDYNKTFCKEISEDFEKNQNIIYFTDSVKYTIWDQMMLFVIYRTLTIRAISEFKKGNMYLYTDDINLKEYEYEFWENLKLPGNEKYLKNYTRL